jgi:hypothetical protein
MSSTKDDYKLYMEQVGSKMKNAPSRRDLEKQKQDNAAIQNGFADVLSKSKERDFEYRGSPVKSTKSVTFYDSMNDRGSPVNTQHFQPNIPAYNAAPAGPPSNFGYNQPYGNNQQMGYNQQMGNNQQMGYNQQMGFNQQMAPAPNMGYGYGSPPPPQNQYNNMVGTPPNMSGYGQIPQVPNTGVNPVFPNEPTAFQNFNNSQGSNNGGFRVENHIKVEDSKSA